ncbi:hypothetical protein [Magnetospira sp. QH-2]|uniref:DUF6967 family protein n=1 Tax=Magnetospira sp. (strain QH-2) TaxID=1288970 RepID=UPI0003E8110C|nr:hypothetical protein [Magnetospira sp. QH-2]CCQ73999.1 Conserved protein of unknown function [Magnetospira sp. QH-2]
MNSGGHGEEVRELEVLPTPWAKEVALQDLTFDGGFKMLRLRIKEKKRFTDLELDIDTAKILRDRLALWVDMQEQG